MKKGRKWAAILLAAVLAVPSVNFNVKSSVVSAQQEVPESTITELDSQYFNLASEGSKIIYDEEKNGFHLIKNESSSNYKIYFYDFKTGEYTKEKTITNAYAVYVSDDAFYTVSSTNEALESEIVENEKTYSYSCSATVMVYDFATGKTNQIKLDSMKSTGNYYNFISAIGVDAKGRIYLANYSDDLCLFDEQGKLLSSIPYTGEIYGFYGFDQVSGNFYYKGKYNWLYWGYDHDMASLMAGNVNEQNKIELPEANLMMLYQSYFYERNKSVEMLNDKYLAILNTFSSPGYLIIMDSNAYDCSDYTAQSTTINAIDSSISVSSLNIKNTDVIKAAVNTCKSVYTSNFDQSSYGTKCDLSKDGKTIYVKSEEQKLSVYDFDTKEAKPAMYTQHPIYAFWVQEDQCYVIEKEADKLYLETINMQVPTAFEVDAPNSMKVAESAKISCSSGSVYKFDYTYESSDPSVVSIDKTGRLNAWKAGSAVITIKAESVNIENQITITVTDPSDETKEAFSVTELSGEESNTIHKQYHSAYYGTTQKSYLAQNADGSYERAEYIKDKKQVITETYAQSGNLVRSKALEEELPIFGGAFIGEKYNYLVFGQMNEEESDECEVFRFVKYDKEWNRLAQCSVKGANTYIPFDAGGLSMTEYGGKLYIHTCHEMYMSEDGYHHQANCTFVVDEETMELEDSYTDVMNLSYGYVSHSFMQLIKTDGEYFYRADLGDAYPRGIALTKTKIGNSVTKLTSYGSLFQIDGSIGQNKTGFSLSGLELSEEFYLVTGLGTELLSDDQRNIFISVGEKAKMEKSKIWITNYENGSNVKISTPKLVKITPNQFLLMWEELSSENGDFVTKMQLLNADGAKIGEEYSVELPLSECQPICDAEGNVVWYVSGKVDVWQSADGSMGYFDDGATTPKLIKINPYKLEKIKSETESGGNESGGNGNETESGGNENGGNGNETESGGNGNETESGGSGNETESGGSGNETESGGNGNETESGGSGNETESGGSGNGGNESGNEKDDINVDEVQKPEKPQKPVIDNVQVIKLAKTSIKIKRTSKKTIQVQIKKVKNAKKYQIQYATNKKFKKAKTKTTTKLKYTIRGLKNGKKYYVRVCAVSGNQKGKWSAVKKK